jgi:hypothetical protein
MTDTIILDGEGNATILDWQPDDAFQIEVTQDGLDLSGQCAN